MDKHTEGDARKEKHAEGCRDHGCKSYCRCWCHGITKHQNGEVRADAKATKKDAVIQAARNLVTEQLGGDYCPICLMYAFRHDSNCKLGALASALQNLEWYETRLR